ncbi:MAG: uridine diphosphate-N-acetylglucosamine-binding protein YvcK, partial [Acidobacteriaceae bacterium]|nr:uridine diphosphate-N-acetylglucosamine-binding protein YvcK [Acidobacteriaceae bacterium]
ILAIRGQIFPATSEDVTLEAVLEDGSIVRGESKISKSKQPIQTVRIRPGNCRPLRETLDALENADLITLGPGSLYTSVIPNLLVSGIAEAIERSPALTVYFVNLMWQPGETMNYTASAHVEAINTHAGRSIVDIAVVNSSPIPAPVKRRYSRARVKPVQNDTDVLDKLGIKVVTADLLGVTPANKIRHDSEALAEVVIDLASRSRAHRVRRRALAADRRRFR